MVGVYDLKGFFQSSDSIILHISIVIGHYSQSSLPKQQEFMSWGRWAWGDSAKSTQ